MKKIYGSIKITLNNSLMVDTGNHVYIMSQEEAEPILSKLTHNDLLNLIVDGGVEIAIPLERTQKIIKYLNELNLVVGC